MTTQYLTIASKRRQMSGYLASLADFSVTPGAAVNPEIVRDSPNISLYCHDDATRRAIFVELPPEVDLAQAPFIYQTQYDQAQRLIAVPYDTFQRLAHELPAIDRLIVVYMTGRSGSTLVSHLFNQLDGVLSLSEPDVTTQFVHLRRPDGRRDAELRALLDHTMRFLFKPTAARTASTAVLKMRSEGVQVMDLFQATFPQARNLFLYRDAIGWVTSFSRIFQRAGWLDPLPMGEFVTLFSQIFQYDFSRLAGYLEAGTTAATATQRLTLWWLAIMEWYLSQAARGIPILPVRYADLNTCREQVVTHIFTYCGFPTAAVQETLGVFARDSQAGTPAARDNPHAGNPLQLTEEQRRDVVRILQRHAVVQESDFVVPGTLHV